MKKFILFVVCLLILLPCAVAHPGKTDDNGGHWDSSTGEYHYHHGYPAHQHIDGACPYEFDDQTGATSGSTSGTTDSEPADLLQEVSNDNTSNEQNNDTVERGDYGPEAETDFETKRDAYKSGFEYGLEYSYDTLVLQL